MSASRLRPLAHLRRIEPSEIAPRIIQPGHDVGQMTAPTPREHNATVAFQGGWIADHDGHPAVRLSSDNDHCRERSRVSDPFVHRSGARMGPAGLDIDAKRVLVTAGQTRSAVCGNSMLCVAKRGWLRRPPLKARTSHQRSLCFQYPGSRRWCITAQTAIRICDLVRRW
jgi:hypothetical protein